MNDRNDKAFARVDVDGSLWERIRFPGLTPGAADIERLIKEVPRLAAALSYKRSKDFALVSFIGGTGTGKSTLFNALCGGALSETGVERPKTCGPVAYAHRGLDVERGYPFPWIGIVRKSVRDAPSTGCAGAPGELLLLEHDREDASHLVIVDTPDVDSLEFKNREAVEDLYLISDAVVFVTSEEKYADEVPFQFLRRVHNDGKPYFLVLNKARELPAPEEALSAFGLEGIGAASSRFRVIPYVARDPVRGICESPAFRQFQEEFFQTFSTEEMPKLLREGRAGDGRRLNARVDALLDLLEKEEQAVHKWLDHLEVFYEATCRDLFEGLERRFAGESREYIQREVRKHFGKYDLLGKPRRFIARIALAPLEYLGLRTVNREESREEILIRMRKKIDLTSIHAAVAGFNRSVLEKLAPQNPGSRLSALLRDPTLALTDEEIAGMVWKEQEQLVDGLEETFRELARGIPKSKEIGIYSTSILWGGLILSLEAAVGGGISVLEAVLDSAIAPFVTKGAVELFAYREIQKIAHDLADRYREGLTSVIRRQRDRYAELIRSLRTGDDVPAALRSLRAA